MGLKALNNAGSVAEAIDFAIQVKQQGLANIRVMNASFFVEENPTLADLIRKARDNGILFVAAAGNFDGVNRDISPIYPANYGSPHFSIANVLSVAATNNRDQLWAKSDFGRNTVHLGAPGEEILFTIPTWDTCVGRPPFDSRFQGACWASGTSAATAHVSGAAAVIFAGCPNLSMLQVKNAILNNVDAKPEALGDKTITGGRLNLDKALRSCFRWKVTVGKAGSGSGTVTSNPTGVDCGTSCVGEFAPDVSVTLTATPASGSTFTGWSGACSGTGSCNLSMNSDKNVTATFATLQTLTLTLARSSDPGQDWCGGSGSVASTPAGMSCWKSPYVHDPVTCTAQFPTGSSVTLNYQPDSYSRVSSWTGACSGTTNSCTVSMSGDKSATLFLRHSLTTFWDPQLQAYVTTGVCPMQ